MSLVGYDVAFRIGRFWVQTSLGVQLDPISLGDPPVDLQVEITKFYD